MSELKNKQSTETDDGAGTTVKTTFVRRSENPSVIYELSILLLKLAIAVAVVVSLFMFVFGAFKAPNTFMEPRIRGGDLVVYYRLAPSFNQNDVVVVSYQGELLLGRVIASAGDTVDISSEGSLIINGATQIETQYSPGETMQVKDGVTFPLTIPDNEVFILGDNRPIAIDSRTFGCVPVDDIQGTVFLQLRRADF